MRFYITILLSIIILSSCHIGPNGASDVPQTNDVVVYQANPRVFAPRNSLKALTAHLDSIQDLGVNLIWLMPIYPVGKVKAKGSPFCVRDYTSIAPEYGTVDDFKQLVDECHSRHIGIIIDWLGNHTSWDHRWIKQHPDWYAHNDKGQIVSPIGPRGEVWSDVAQLNYDNLELRDTMTKAMEYWVHELNIDGFMCNSAYKVSDTFWTYAFKKIRQKNPKHELHMFAEGEKPRRLAEDGFNFNCSYTYIDTLFNVFSNGHSAQNLFQADHQDYALIPPTRVKLRYITDHNLCTTSTPVDTFRSKKASIAAWVATIFMHGGAQFYSSQEVGHPTPIDYTRYTPVDWRANSDLYQEYRKLMEIYKNHKSFHDQGPSQPAGNNDILVILKGSFRHAVIVNVRDSTCKVTLPTALKNRMMSNLYTEEPIMLETTLEMKPYEYLLLQAQ